MGEAQSEPKIPPPPPPKKKKQIERFSRFNLTFQGFRCACQISNYKNAQYAKNRSTVNSILVHNYN